MDGTVKTFEFPALKYQVECTVMAIGTSPVYVRFDGTPAVIEDDDTFVIPGNTAREFDLGQRSITGGTGYYVSINGASSNPSTTYGVELRRGRDNQ